MGDMFEHVYSMRYAKVNLEKVWLHNTHLLLNIYLPWNLNIIYYIFKWVRLEDLENYLELCHLQMTPIPLKYMLR